MFGMVKLLAIVFALVFCAPLFASEGSEPIRMEDGSYVFVDPEDGATRMVDASGRPMKMRDDVEMRTADGEVIVMRNHRIWKLVGPPGKKKRSSSIE